MTKIVLHGINGRMGRALCGMIAPRKDCEVVAGIDTADAPGGDVPVFPSIEAYGSSGISADVLIDFSLPAATRAALAWCGANGLPCVVCTTGLDEDTLQLLKNTAQTVAVFFSANMSLGVNLLAKLARMAQSALPGFDIEIVEKHHRHKLDAPSGTALMLADTINQQANGRYHYVYDRHSRRAARADDEIGISAVRGGSIVGEHEVLFAGPDEVVTLSHTAYSREVFASGAIAAALYLANKGPGQYSMDDFMEDL
ncbi:4-hydroxy-tetrahydrodipicolinate reductase [Ruminococcaceae bacterium OttesenSCG-928-O06]|nr:4-hydroxy-tetrahydrodipicolinate reductase [Ruminococcaceae bacterium OttesenSCG-928-O06]